ncbi:MULTISPECIES: hypothetical protein [unclassified Rhizobium]|nr:MULTISPECIES: hypothetical protein [unclassified Rhizobium]RKD72702.1 hypothetical protein BJ928_102487 [Rhizobium sp. WW_1]
MGLLSKAMKLVRQGLIARTGAIGIDYSTKRDFPPKVTQADSS